jgi:hypothetical protein
LFAGDVFALGFELEVTALTAVENRTKSSWGIEVRKTKPVDRSVGAHHCRGVHVAVDSEVADRRGIRI